MDIGRALKLALNVPFLRENLRGHNNFRENEDFSENFS
jgi:hypothetical protein